MTILADFQKIDLLMWTSPVKSAGALVVFNLCFVLFVFFDVSLTPLFCTVGMLAIGLGFAAKFVAPQLANSDLALASTENITKAVEALVDASNLVVGNARDVAMWKDTSATVSALVLLEFLRRIEPWVSLAKVAFLGGNSLFILPYLCEAKKDVIEQSVMPHLKMLTAFKDELLAKVPRFVPPEEKKDQ